jgi:hypothetical protein
VIKVYCNGTRIQCLRQGELNVGMVGAPVEFDFSSEWDGLGKTAVFRCDGEKDNIIGADGKTTVPHEILTTPGMDVEVGVYAVKEDGTTWPAPTTYCKIGRVGEGADPSGDESYPPTPGVGEQAVAAASKALEAAAEAQEVAEDIQRRADAGEFDGKPGEPGKDGEPGEKGEAGGYYTPSVTQEDDMLRFSFASSEEDMPTVGDVTVDLPGGSVELDPTLTQSGKAADAKAAGDALAGKIDVEKYGIVAVNYVAPFTAAMYEVAYQNGVGIQNAIDDAKAKGMERITLPAGNYPLCYHAAADEEYNAIIDASGIDFYGYGVKLYVIYDEEGTNPYFTGATPRLLQGTIIKTDRDVSGFHLVGERRFRKDVNTKYRDCSKGIGLTHTANGNILKDCLTECVSGDGIGNESYMEQIAGWTPDTFTSIEWDYTTGAYVESNYMFVSTEHGGDWIDKTRPLLIRNTGYFLYSSAPLIIRCWNSAGEHIGVVQFWQGEYFYLPENTAKWRLELTRTVWHESTVTETWSFWIGYGTYSGTKIINCESRLNQRGGMSNLPNDVLLENCYIHNNGNAGEGMVQYYDTTRFGIDIEDIWIHKSTLDGCRIMDNFNNLLFRCGNVVLKQSIIGNVYAMNQVVDFYAEQCVFTGDVKFENPTPFGNKLAVGCTFGGAIPDSLLVLDNHALASAEFVSGTMVMRNTAGDTICTVDMSEVMPAELTADGLCMHYDFRQTPADPRQPVDLVHGLPIYDARYTADNYSADGVVLCEGSGGKGFSIASTEIPSHTNYAQVPEYAAFAEALRSGSGFTVECFGGECPWYSVYGYNMGMEVRGAVSGGKVWGLRGTFPYLNSSGESNRAGSPGSDNFVDDAGNTHNVYNNPEDFAVENGWHFVVTADEAGAVRVYLNGFPESTFTRAEDFAAWDYDKILSPVYWNIARGYNESAGMNKKPIASVRMYNRALSLDEVRNNYRYELNYKTTSGGGGGLSQAEVTALIESYIDTGVEF